MKRLFFALWPDNAVRGRLAEIAGLLPVNTGRRVPPDNFHITLAFLGNVQELVVPELAAAAEQMRQPSFSLQIDRCGWWKRAKVAWLAPGNHPCAPAGPGQADQPVEQNSRVACRQSGLQPPSDYCPQGGPSHNHPVVRTDPLGRQAVFA